MNNRRDFLKVTLGLAAGLAVSESLVVAQDEKKAKKKGKRGPRKIRIGCQLYAVRNDFTKDVPGTLKTLAGMGYVGVEPWGYGGTEYVFKDGQGKEWSAKELRELLDANKLRCCGIHCNGKALEAANLERTVANMKVLGNRYINVASPPYKMKTADDVKKFATFMNETAAKVKDQGMFVGYHCHGGDFDKIDGVMMYEMLFDQLVPEVNMQVDIGHALKAGVDPIVYLKKFAGRAKTVHLRENPPKYTFDSPEYKAIFEALETVAGTQWYIVEEETGASFDFSRQAIEKLKKLGK